jgi:hypothetical protein
MPYPKIIVLGDFALPQNVLPQNALPQNNWPANPALAGFWQGLKPGLNHAVNGAVNGGNCSGYGLPVYLQRH